MAEFTDQDKELLDKLRKMFEATGKTRSQLDPWQEHLERNTSVNANKAALASKIVAGFSGSWAAQYNFGEQSIVQPSGNTALRARLDADPQGPPIPVRAKESKIGKRGMPEVGFVPYNWRTNTFGSKGPSLVGHPISFEVVGPTLKSPFCDWTWEVSLGAGPNGGDTLTPDTRPDGTPSPRAGDVDFMYGPNVGAIPWTIGDIAEPNGGLYLIVSDDGANPGSIPAGTTPMGALPRFVDTARFEVFRVASIDGDVIEIHPNKSFSEFFDLDAIGPRHIRAITLIHPYVARLAAVPQSGAAGGNDGMSVSGREQTFVVLSPERAASPDTYPPYGDNMTSGTWLGGEFTETRAPGSSMSVGDPALYGGQVRLPNPKPVSEVTGEIDVGPILPTDPVGNWFISTSATGAFSTTPFDTELPIVHIFATTRDDDLPNITFGSVESAMGWFDVQAIENAPRMGVILGRVNETSPLTGQTYFGPGPYIQSAAAPPPNLGVGMTLHRSVSSVFQGIYKVDEVDACRLTNLIDPNWVSRFEKQISDPTAAPPPGGSGPGRSDKAIFDTRSFEPPGGGLRQAADPGNLMDLGFRMVLFPAKQDTTGNAVPDFDRPILGRELIIDGSLTDKQFVEIDYSGGIVRFSNPPPTSRVLIPDEETDVIPNGIPGAGANNPREEVVLFAACVPYSMEDSQVGTGARITSHLGVDGTDEDVSSKLVVAAIDTDNTAFSGTAPFIGPSTVAPMPEEIILDRIWDGPETGVISIASGNDDSPSFGRWGYTETRVVTASGVVGPVTALGGISAIPGASDPDPGLSDPLDPRSVILRREVVFGEESLALPALTDFYITDTTYGSQIRADILRFQDCTTQYNQDGSVTIVPRSPGFLWNQRGSWTASGILDGVSGDDRLSTQGVMAGVYYQDETGNDEPSDGTTLQDEAGQYTRFTSASNATDYEGVVTRKSLISLQHSFRLVTKFRFASDNAIGLQGFIGLVGPRAAGEPPASSLVFQPLPPIPSPPFDILGLRLQGAFPGLYSFFTQNANNPGLLERPTSITQGGVFYFVIENVVFRDAVIPGARASYVKMGLFDATFVQLASTRFYNQEQVPRGISEMEFVIGTRNPDGTGIRWIDFYSAVLVNHTELPFKALP